MTSTAAAATMSPTQGRLQGVDLLRALAISLVLLNHVNMRLALAKIPYTRGLPSQLVQSLVWNGQRGVQIFFAVSGFLITSTALRRWAAKGHLDVGQFYRFRFARIAPLLLLLLTILSALHLAGVKNFVVPSKTGGLGRALFAALTFHVNVLEATRGYLPGNWDILWSLSVEEVFYLFFPLLLKLLGRGKWLVGFLLLFVILGPPARTVFSQGNGVWKEYSYLGGMDAIAMGCLTALWLDGRSLYKRGVEWFAAGGIALLIGGLTLTNLARNVGLERTGLDLTLLGVGACLTIVAAARTQWRSPGFLQPILMFGERSYEIYLTHMFVVFACFELFLRAGKPMWAIPLFFAAVFVISAPLGELIGRTYADPLNRRLRASAR